MLQLSRKALNPIRLIFVWLALFAPTCAFGEPIQLHPKNNHYFLWRGQPTILVTSGEHYGAVLNLDFDFERYLQELAADGLNHTRTFSGTYREVPGSFGITDNTLSPLPGRFACPWARSQTPGALDGGSKFDLTKFDDAYFQRLRSFFAAAEKAGVVVEFNLFCPLYHKELWAVSPMNVKNNVNGLGDCPRDETLSLKHPALVEAQLAFVRRVVRELNHFDNLYYEVCNEPYVRKVPNDWQQRIADEIVATEKTLSKRHLISLNIANGRERIDQPWPNVSIYNFHYCVPPDVVALNYGLNKVIGENETGFRGRDDFLYRSEAWDFLLAGGALYNNLDYSFTPKHPGGDFLDYQSPGGGSPALRRQLGVLKRFLEGFQFVEMTPDGRAISSVSNDLQARALSEPGKAYAIYLRVAVPDQPKVATAPVHESAEGRLRVNLPAGNYDVSWLDTLTGANAGSDRVEHSGGELSLQSPAFVNDIALGIVRSDQPQKEASQ
jgi:hypothetical protein